MLRNSLLLLVIALMAASLVFGLVAGTAELIARILFVIFLILFAASLFRRRRA